MRSSDVWSGEAGTDDARSSVGAGKGLSSLSATRPRDEEDGKAAIVVGFLLASK
jgi:hypothetical protein